MCAIQRTATWLVALGLIAPALGLQAQGSTEFSGHLSGGLEYDSNVTVDEVNASSDQSDEAWVFDAGLEGILQPAEALRLALGYSLSGRRYHNLGQFDQNIHVVSADLSYDFDPVTIGASYHYSYATLGSDAFLDFRRASVYLGSLIGENVYLMASLQDKAKDFEDDTARNSDIRGGSVDAFFFFNEGKSNLLFGIDLDREDAVSDAYDNRLVRLRAAFVHRFTVGGEQSRFRLSWRFENQKYDEAVGSSNIVQTPLTTSRRLDRARIVDAGWRIGLNEVFSLEPRVSYGHYSSNLDSADYDQAVVGLALRAGF